MTWWPGPRRPYEPGVEGPCGVCELVRGRSPEPVVHRDRVAVTYLVRPPAVPGHLIVAPVRHVEAVIDLSASEYTELYEQVHAAATAVAAVVPADRLLQVSTGAGHLRHELVPLPPGAPPGVAALDLATLGLLDLPAEQEAAIAAAVRERLAR